MTHPDMPSRPARATPRAVQVGKVLAYFLLLLLGMRILDHLVGEAIQYAGELKGVRGLVASILDANKNLDDVIVTFFTLSTTFLLIVPVSWVLRLTRGDESEPSLTQTLIVLSMIVAGVTLLLQDSLARSFGLVGVVAAVRYRNTLKDSKDAVYVFLALGIGMACGLHAYPVAALLSLFECAVLLGLWLLQRSPSGLQEANLLARLKASEKKGDRTTAQALAWLTPEGRERLEDDLRAQSRYITMASLLTGKHGRKPNAAITVQTTGAQSARDSINAQMEEHGGGWQLLGAEEVNGVTTLEYLGRVPRRKSPPVKFIERLQRADPDVGHVTFRSLRKMVADKIDVGETPHEQADADHPPVQSPP